MKKGNWKFFGLAVLIALGSFGCEYVNEETPVVTTPTPGQVLPIGGAGVGPVAPPVFCSVVPSQGTVTAGKNVDIFVTLENSPKATITFGSQTSEVTASQTVNFPTTDPGTYTLFGQALDPEGVPVPCIVALNSVTVLAPEETPPADTTPPAVSATNPTNGAAGVSASTAITVTFSEPVETVAAANFSVAGTVTMLNDVSAKLVPSTAFTAGQIVSVTISGIEDKAGNVMAAPHTFSFTVAGGVGPVGPVVRPPFGEIKGFLDEPVVKSEPVDGLVLKLMTGKFRDMKMDDEQIRFDLCPTSDFENDPKCFRAKFGDGGFLELNNGKYESIDFTNLPDGSVKVLSERKVADLKYPDDFKYFRLAPDCDTAFSPGWDSCDGWFLAGVELLVRPQGGNFKSVYRNPCVNRWIDESEDGDWSNESPHSLDDDAYCFYVETCSDDDADTESSVKIEIPVNQPLETSMTSWLTESYAGEGAKIENVKDGALPFGLNWNWFTTGEFDDFERSNFTLTSSPYNHYSQTTSYGATVYDGRNRLKDEYRVKITGDDAWHLCKIHVYHIRPGDRKFLDSLDCKANKSNLNVWISTQLTDSNVESQYWPFSPVDGFDYMTLGDDHCGGFDTIEWGKGADGFGKY